MNNNFKRLIYFIILAATVWVWADCSLVLAQGPIRQRLREKILSKADSSTAGDIKKSIVVDGITRTYIVHLPDGYAQDQAYPLVFVLHGGTANAENAMRMSQMNPKSDQEGFIVVYPNGSGRFADKFLHWNDGSQRSGNGVPAVDDIAFFRQLISQLEKDYNIDTARIYATGLSNGAIMTYRLGCELSDKFAAIAPVAGALNYNQSAPINPLAIIIFHGTEDQYVLYNGGAGKAAGGRERIDQSVAYAVNFWVGHNGCGPVPEREEFGSIVKERYSGGKANTEVVLYTINGGGHSWPGGITGIRYGNADPPTQEISATDLIWEFFAAHPKDK